MWSLLLLLLLLLYVFWHQYSADISSHLNIDWITVAKYTKRLIFQQFASANLWSHFSFETMKFLLGRIPAGLEPLWKWTWRWHFIDST